MSNIGHEYHIPVMEKEVLSLLCKEEGGIFMDCTLGGGGHSHAILSSFPNASVLGLDQDMDAISFASKRLEEFGERVMIAHVNFSGFEEALFRYNIEKLDGILLDLGVSSYQIDETSRGFRYMEECGLDMRMDQGKKMQAKDVLNHFDQEEIARIFFQYGEERKSRYLAQKIVARRQKRPFEQSSDLTQIIKESVGQKNYIKTCSRVFQSLRIFINNELEVLETTLPKFPDYLKPGGRIAVISYHSLEDRIVKRFFRYEEKECICPANFPQCTCDKVKRLQVITKKPAVASDEETGSNIRARSASLRVAERV